MEDILSTQGPLSAAEIADAEELIWEPCSKGSEYHRAVEYLHRALAELKQLKAEKVLTKDQVIAIWKQGKSVLG